MSNIYGRNILTTFNLENRFQRLHPSLFKFFLVDEPHSIRIRIFTFDFFFIYDNIYSPFLVIYEAHIIMQTDPQ